MVRETDSKRLLDGLGLSPDAVSEEAAGKLMELAISNARLSARITTLETQLKRAQLLADHDPLCPLFNRRAFLRELTREIALAGRHKTGLSVLYLDLDQFKRINDVHGHEVGDEVLVEVAKLLKANVRRSDIVARIGGDEFAIVLVKSDPSQTTLRVSALAQIFKRGGANLYGIKASIGAVAWRTGMTASEIMQEADRAMFANKSGLKSI
jgi:diguanylate cyclase (GGDEF)-like protein